MPNEKLDKLKAVLGLLDDGKPTAAQLETFLKSVLKLIGDLKKSLDQRVDNALDSLSKRIDARLAKIKDGAQGPKGEKGDKGDSIVGPKGEKGEPGQDAKPLDVDEALDRVEKRLPQLGESIVDSINLLPTDNDEDKIDASHIKNLPEPRREVIRGGGATTLFSLSDVYIPGIQSGQSITWNGTFWEAYTPAGGSGATPVYGEVLQTQDTTGSIFTLADTPTAGSVRLFRGGAYQSIANGDYSIASDTITLTTALQDGETLVADYTPA